MAREPVPHAAPQFPHLQRAGQWQEGSWASLGASRALGTWGKGQLSPPSSAPATQGSGRPLSAGAWLGGRMAPAEGSGRGSQSPSGGPGALEQGQENAQSRLLAAKRARSGGRGDGRGWHRLVPGARPGPGCSALTRPVAAASLCIPRCRGTGGCFGGHSEPRTVAASPGSAERAQDLWQLSILTKNDSITSSSLFLFKTT